jgi:hypothetical protein
MSILCIDRRPDNTYAQHMNKRPSRVFAAPSEGLDRTLLTRDHRAAKHAPRPVAGLRRYCDITFQLGDDWYCTSAWVVHTTIRSAFDGWCASMFSRVDANENE